MSLRSQQLRLFLHDDRELEAVNRLLRELAEKTAGARPGEARIVVSHDASQRATKRGGFLGRRRTAY